ncbi:uncharacterized protein LOC141857936 isoform X2 [Brevipalpus obovatus]|uniref:uncharacterized protein LOC141857936 isoform X2 n=1 Tax=Brevipalpus obovatus TaxID=246614 RepID=UPI003D9F64F0
MEFMKRSIDNSSIIENKQVIKKYWETRMMEDQAAYIESLKKSPNSIKNMGQDVKQQQQQQQQSVIANGKPLVNMKIFNPIDRSNNCGTKLGSDGESEGSLDCSLSPIEVDSMDDGERTSPDSQTTSGLGDDDELVPSSSPIVSSASPSSDRPNDGGHDEGHCQSRHSFQSMSSSPPSSRESAEGSSNLDNGSSSNLVDDERRTEEEKEEEEEEKDDQEMSNSCSGSKVNGQAAAAVTVEKKSSLCELNANVDSKKLTSSRGQDSGVKGKDNEQQPSLQQQQLDSLEEFIKIENECKRMKDATSCDDYSTNNDIIDGVPVVVIDSNNRQHSDYPVSKCTKSVAGDHHHHSDTLSSDTHDTEKLIDIKCPVISESKNSGSDNSVVKSGNIPTTTPTPTTTVSNGNLSEELSSGGVVFDDANLDNDLRPMIIGQVSKNSETTTSDKVTVSSMDTPTNMASAEEKLNEINGLGCGPITNGISNGNGRRSVNGVRGPGARPPPGKTAESIIAEEIRQLREREEELALMRQQMKMQINSSTSLSSSSTASDSGASTLITSNCSIGSSKSSIKSSSCEPSDSVDGKCSPAFSDLSSCSVGTLSSDSVDHTPSRSLGLEVTCGRSAAHPHLNESPIEREIRLAREREMELKAQKNLIIQSHGLSATCGVKVCNGSSSPFNGIDRHNGRGKIDTVTTTATTTSTTTGNNNLPKPATPTNVSNGLERKSSNGMISLKQANFGAANAADIQKLLATTRIQQEIQEQTQREIALRASGSIKTISQERTDVKVTKLGEIEKNMSSSSTLSSVSPGSCTPESSSSKPLSPTSSDRPPITVAKINANGLSASSINGTLSPQTSSLSSSFSPSSASSAFGSQNSSITSSSNHSPSTTNTTTTSQTPSSATFSTPNLHSIGMNRAIRTGFQPFAQKGMVKTISMHKFISSKGKAVTANGTNRQSFASSFLEPDDFSGDLPPPIMIKGGFRRGSVSAESKIQEELKEMKAREEELRRQRARLLGRSQPNLSNLICSDENDMGSPDNQHQDNGMEDDNRPLKRTISNPNLIQKITNGSQLFGTGKHRNPLIAQWEEKINKDNQGEKQQARC